MKKRIVFSFIATVMLFLAVTTAGIAGDCSVSACGGGTTGCCIDSQGNLFLMTRVLQ